MRVGAIMPVWALAAGGGRGKKTAVAALVLLWLAAGPAGATALHGEAAKCAAGAAGPAVHVRVTGFRDREGQLRVQVYRARQDEYLASGRYVARVDTPMTPAGDIAVCVPLPEAGPHVVAVMHDRDRSGRLNPWRDGVGFAGNPRLGLSKPPLERVTVTIEGVHRETVVLNYLRGLSVRPL
jgi:uncharacterized protein (DUF2141 family)